MKSTICFILKMLFAILAIYIAFYLLISYCLIENKIPKDCALLTIYSYKICLNRLFVYLQSIGFFSTISIVIYKYLEKKENQEYICGHIKNCIVSKDKKRLIIDLYLKNDGKFPVEFEFIAKNNNFKPKYKVLFEDLVDERCSSDEDTIEIPKTSWRLEDANKPRVGEVFISNEVCKPIIVNNEIFQNYIYMRQIENDNSIHKNFDQNIIVPSKASIQIRLDLSKGFYIKENFKLKKIFIYSVKGTVFKIKYKLLERIKNKCKEWMKKQENS